MRTHSIPKSAKPFKTYLEWGVAIALVILAALVIYAATANQTVTTTTDSLAPVISQPNWAATPLDQHERHATAVAPSYPHAEGPLDQHERHP